MIAIIYLISAAAIGFYSYRLGKISGWTDGFKECEEANEKLIDELSRALREKNEVKQ